MTGLDTSQPITDKVSLKEGKEHAHEQTEHSHAVLEPKPAEEQSNAEQAVAELNTPSG